jgi:hypothetical protein
MRVYIQVHTLSTHFESKYARIHEGVGAVVVGEQANSISHPTS